MGIIFGAKKHESSRVILRQYRNFYTFPNSVRRYQHWTQEVDGIMPHTDYLAHIPVDSYDGYPIIFH